MTTEKLLHLTEPSLAPLNKDSQNRELIRLLWELNEMLHANPMDWPVVNSWQVLQSCIA